MAVVASQRGTAGFAMRIGTDGTGGDVMMVHGMALSLPLERMRMDELPVRDRIQFFEDAIAAHRVGRAQKIGVVDARPARDGEIVVSIIAGEGLETTSRPAQLGDWVVRSRFAQTGFEEQLVDGAVFATRYSELDGTKDEAGFTRFTARFDPVLFCRVQEADGEFALRARWGELQRCRPGDAVVQLPGRPDDIYRVQAQAFALNYRVIEQPERS
jgi:hypothetical protein